MIWSANIPAFESSADNHDECVEQSREIPSSYPHADSGYWQRMTAPIDPLRKLKDGVPLTRQPEVVAAIERTFTWTFEELLQHAAINDRRHALYVPSEALMYRLRATKKDNSDKRFLALYDIIKRRLEAACARATTSEGETVFENAKLADIRDRLVAHVVDLVLADRQDYSDKLDFFEVRFERAIRLLRIDKFRRIARHEVGKVALEYDDGSGEIIHEAEEGLASMRENIRSSEDDLTYRLSLRRAIDALPDEERKVIELILAGVTIESKDPNEISIVNLLGTVEKTVRNRRDRAITKIRAALKLGDSHE